MRLSDIKGMEAIEATADLMEPIAMIATCDGIAEARKQLATDLKKAGEEKDEAKARKATVLAKAHFAQRLLRSCAEEIIMIFAILDRTPIEKYEFTLSGLPQKIVELMNDPYIMQLFGLQSENKTSSGSATENTEVEEN